MKTCEPIGRIELTNQGGFVVKMDFVFLARNGRHVRLPGSRKDITLGRSECQDPGDFGMPDCAEFTIHADVVWGRDNVGPVWFVYDPCSARKAKFTISGTTLHNRLGFNGIE